MKKTFVAALASACLCAGVGVRGQPPADCKPNALEHSWRAVSLHLSGQPRHVSRRRARRAEGESPDRSGLRHEQGTRWVVVRDDPPQVVGFHYYTLSIDGAVVADPATRTFFGSGYDNSAFEVPDPDGDYYSLKDVPHGQVRQQRYFSNVRGHGGVPTSIRRLTTTPTRRRSTRCCICCTAGEKTSRVGHPGPRRRDHGQPDRREEGQAHDYRHGQPQCGEAG